MRILFVDLDYHLKTKSADFFLAILRTHFEVETHYYASPYQANIPADKLARADLVIVWEMLLGRNSFVPPGKPCIYVPMYDADWGSRAQWRRIARSGCRVIAFCDAVANFARRGGVPKDHLLNLRYAFNPADYCGFEGDPHVAALWERGFFGFAEMKRLFKPGFFRKIILFRRPQPGLVFAPISDEDRRAYNLQVCDSDYLPRNEYLELLREPGVYIAPRPKEGIGMAFLEQMAMGKCVIVHDDASMNEYVQDGVNGVVRDFYAPELQPISHADIERVRQGIRQSAQRQYMRWIEDEKGLESFISRTGKGASVHLGGLMDAVLRAAYVVEAALASLRHCR